MIFDEVLENLRHGPNEGGAAQAWLVTISVFRDDAPWAYEPGLELYRALKLGGTEKIRKELDAYEGLILSVGRSGLLRDLFVYDEESHDLMMLIPDVLLRAVNHLQHIYRSSSSSKRGAKITLADIDL